MELRLYRPALHQVRRGQTLDAIARAFGTTARCIAYENALREEPAPGTLLRIPAGGNRYVVAGGESRTLLCGSPAAFYAKNHTNALYPGEEVLL